NSCASCFNSTACPTGKFVNSHTDGCIDCPRGRAAPLPGSAFCTICPLGLHLPFVLLKRVSHAGKFASSVGQADCQEAPAGFFTASDGATGTEECPVGASSPAGSATVSSLSLLSLDHLVVVHDLSTRFACFPLLQITLLPRKG